MLTITNTHPDFAWLTNYLETLLSNVLWKPVTSATIADVFKRQLINHAQKTGFYNLSVICRANRIYKGYIFTGNNREQGT
jgi:nicotinamide phosphoribosyltransferase